MKKIVKKIHTTVEKNSLKDGKIFKCKDLLQAIDQVRSQKTRTSFLIYRVQDFFSKIHKT